MKTLENQLAEYGGLQEEVFGPIALDEITSRTVTLCSQPEPGFALASGSPGDSRHGCRPAHDWRNRAVDGWVERARSSRPTCDAHLHDTDPVQHVHTGYQPDFFADRRGHMDDLRIRPLWLQHRIPVRLGRAVR